MKKTAVWMSDDAPVENLSPQEALLLSSLRNYDVLLTILTVLDKDAAQRLYEAHEEGQLVGPELFYLPPQP